MVRNQLKFLARLQAMVFLLSDPPEYRACRMLQKNTEHVYSFCMEKSMNLSLVLIRGQALFRATVFCLFGQEDEAIHVEAAIHFSCWDLSNLLPYMQFAHGCDDSGSYCLFNPLYIYIYV